MLPVNADSGWHCTVNGEERAISRLDGNLMLVPLDEGTNEDYALLCAAGNEKGRGGDGHGTDASGWLGRFITSASGEKCPG